MIRVRQLQHKPSTWLFAQKISDCSHMKSKTDIPCSATWNVMKYYCYSYCVTRNGPVSHVWVLTHSLLETMISMLLNAQQEWETTQTVCGSLRAEPREKEKAVRLTKISLNAFNGAERAISLWCMPVKAPFGFAVRVSLRVQWATNGVAWEQSVSEESEQREHRDHTGLTPHTHTHFSGLAHITMRRTCRKTQKCTADW